MKPGRCQGAPLRGGESSHSSSSPGLRGLWLSCLKLFQSEREREREGDRETGRQGEGEAGRGREREGGRGGTGRRTGRRERAAFRKEGLPQTSTSTRRGAGWGGLDLQEFSWSPFPLLPSTSCCFSVGDSWLLHSQHVGWDPCSLERGPHGKLLGNDSPAW